MLSGFTVTVTKIKQERTNQDWTEIGPFLDSLRHFSIFFVEILSTAQFHNSIVKLCSKFQVKILKNVGENRRKDQS